MVQGSGSRTGRSTGAGMKVVIAGGSGTHGTAVHQRGPGLAGGAADRTGSSERRALSGSMLGRW
jgi:hypothetical protein